MSLQRLVVSNFATGLETDLTPFLINNDAFPTLNNAYVWRGRVLRKRGTSLLGRLRVALTGESLGNTDGAGAFSGNIFTILGIDVLAPNAQIAKGSIEITIGAQVFTEPAIPDGTLTNGGAGTGTINYSSGAITIQTDPVLPATAIIIEFAYFPSEPVLGLEDFDVGNVDQPLLISFDTLFSYGIDQGLNQFYNVNFFKSTGQEFNWEGENYEQFWTENYLGVTTLANTANNTGCLWATNGNPGMHFITILNVVIAAPNTAGAVATITTTAAHNLTNSDFVFVNEAAGLTRGAATPTGTFGGFNGASGQVTVTGANTFTLPTPYADGAYVSGGIVQYMTRNSATGEDGIRWYDGDPTSTTDYGWVNFAPPLSEYNSLTNVNPQYLVGAKAIVPFKGRLLFFGVYLRTSAVSPGIQFYPNRMVYSEVGSPYYSRPLPFVLSSQNPVPEAWFQNVAGRGGFITAPVDEEIVTVDTNEDILVVGMESRPLKLISTGNDALPFIYQTISSEYGALATFSSVQLDAGVLYIGEYGIVMITSTSGQRIDLKIPDQVFSNIGKRLNRVPRITAIRDYQKEFIYFTYASASRETSIFPNQTLLYNYRDQTWATFDENFTRYGTFRRTTNRTWSVLGAIYGTWSNWTDPWNYGANNAFFPQIVAGNQQGFVLQKGDGTGEGNSNYIEGITGNTITSPDHCMNNGDLINISGMIGAALDNPIQMVKAVTQNTFEIDDTPTGTYLGGGVFKRYSRPEILTKQFPIFWQTGMGCRIGTQRFLLETTSRNDVDETNFPQITVSVYVSQNSSTPANDPSSDGYLPYSNIVLTCAEPGNDFSGGQAQIWHRLSNSFSGDTVQMEFTLSNAQMRNPNVNEQEIILHAIVVDLYPGRMLSF